jgi:hypothetical protein
MKGWCAGAAFPCPGLEARQQLIFGQPDVYSGADVRSDYQACLRSRG